MEDIKRLKLLEVKTIMYQKKLYRVALMKDIIEEKISEFEDIVIDN